MKVRIRLIGCFIPRYGFGEKELEVPSPCTAGDLQALLGMQGVENLMTVQGRGLKPEDPLAEGDRVVVAPIFSGG